MHDKSLILDLSVAAAESAGVREVVAEGHNVSVHPVLVGEPLQGGRVGLAETAEKTFRHSRLERFLFRHGSGEGEAGTGGGGFSVATAARTGTTHR